MNEQERTARIEELELQVARIEFELEGLRKAGKKRHFGDLLGIAKGLFPPDLDKEEIDSWKYSFDESWLDEPAEGPKAA